MMLIDADGCRFHYMRLVVFVPHLQSLLVCSLANICVYASSIKYTNKL